MDEQLRAAERGIADKQQELDRLASQHDSARSLIAVRAERMRELESQIADRDRKVRSFDEQIVALSQQHEATVGRLQREHAEALARATAAARPPDDLKQLHGIGPKFERLLHAAGIRRFAQIAGWTRQDVATVAERLGIRPGRIERDNWVESARRLLGDGGD